MTYYKQNNDIHIFVHQNSITAQLQQIMTNGFLFWLIFVWYLKYCLDWFFFLSIHLSTYHSFLIKNLSIVVYRKLIFFDLLKEVHHYWGLQSLPFFLLLARLTVGFFSTLNSFRLNHRQSVITTIWSKRNSMDTILSLVIRNDFPSNEKMKNFQLE